jgi:hypothetical protein
MLWSSLSIFTFSHSLEPNRPIVLRKSRLPPCGVSGRGKGAARWHLSSSLALRKSGDL